MSVKFAAGQELRFSPGSATFAANVAMSYVAVIARNGNAGVYNNLLSVQAGGAGTPGTVTASVELNTSNALEWSTNGGLRGGAGTATTGFSGDTQFRGVAATIAAGATGAVNLHTKNIDAGTAIARETATSSGSGSNAIDSTFAYALGQWADADDLAGWFAVLAVFAGALTNAQVDECFANKRTSDIWNCSAGRPKMLFELTSLTPTDLTGGGAAVILTQGPPTVDGAKDPSGWTYDGTGATATPGPLDPQIQWTDDFGPGDFGPNPFVEDITPVVAAAAVVTADLTATLGGAGAITANLTAPPLLSATLAGAGSIAATLTAPPLITATVAGAGTIAASLTAPSLMSATLAGAGAINAALTAPALLSATLAGQGAISANLTVPGGAALTATLAGTGQITANLTAASLLTGSLAGVGALTAALTAAPKLASTLTGTGSLTGALTAPALLTVTLAGAGSLTGNLTVPGSAFLIATLSGAGSIAGNLTASPRLTGTLTGAGQVTAGLTASPRLTASLAGAGSITGTVSIVPLVVAVGRFEGGLTTSSPDSTSASQSSEAAVLAACNE